MQIFNLQHGNRTFEEFNETRMYTILAVFIVDECDRATQQRGEMKTDASLPNCHIVLKWV